MICSGSHIESLNMLKSKDADITCIDSNTFINTNGLGVWKKKKRGGAVF